MDKVLVNAGGESVGILTTGTAPAGTPPHKMGYLEFFEDAERRHKRGERQRICTNCSLWRWDDEACESPSCAGKPRHTKQQNDVEVRRIKKWVAKKYPSAEARYRKAIKKAGLHGP